MGEEMSDLYWVFQSIWSWIGVGLALIWFVYGLLRAGWFIAEMVIEPEDGWFRRTIKRVHGIWKALVPSVSRASWSRFFASFRLIPALPGRRFRAARYYAELQILQPPVAFPDRRDYNDNEYTRRRERALKEKDERNKSVEDLLRECLGQDPTLRVAVFHSILRTLGWMSGEDKPLEPDPVKVTDFPQVDDSRKKIKRYFEALDRRSKDWFTKTNDPKRFLTEAKLESGYIAPIFLITGRLTCPDSSAHA